MPSVFPHFQDMALEGLNILAAFAAVKQFPVKRRRFDEPRDCVGSCFSQVHDRTKPVTAAPGWTMAFP